MSGMDGDALLHLMTSRIMTPVKRSLPCPPLVVLLTPTFVSP
jgi:hypothetical protein